MKRLWVKLCVVVALIGMSGLNSPLFAQSGSYQWPYWHDATSDAVFQDALPNTGRMLVWYYSSSDPQAAAQRWRLQDVGRYWKEQVRFYSVDVDNDTDCCSRVHQVPTLLMIVRGSNGQLVLLNSAVGYLDDPAIYDFFVKSMKNPGPGKSGCLGKTARATAADIPYLLQGHEYAVVLYYNSTSLLSTLYAGLFEQTSASYGDDVQFVKVNIAQDEQDTNRLGGIPAVVIYHQDCHGCLVESSPARGFRDAATLETWIDSQILPCANPTDKR